MLCLTIWTIDLVTVGVYGGFWKEGCNGGLGSRHSFPSKEAPEEGKVGMSWCQWLSIYWGVLCCSLILSMIIGGRKYWHQLLLLSLQLEFPATPVHKALT